MARSTGYEFDENLLNDMEFRFQKAASLMESLAKHEDAVILVGNTKVGKSTLINSLMGNKLKAQQNLKRKFFITKADNADGPEIGIETISKTEEPRRFESRISELILYDLPGFCDNRNNIQDIVNGVYVCELLKHLKSAKMILVISWDDLINDDIALLVRSLNSVEKLLGVKMNDCFSSIGVIISKVDQKEQVDKEYICELLRGQLLSNDQLKLSAVVKSVLMYLILNQQNIGIFNRPISNEVTIEDIECGVIDAIYNVKGIPNEILKEVSPTISEGSQVFLNNIRGRLITPKHFIDLQGQVAGFLKKSYTPPKKLKNCGIDEINQISENSTQLKFKVDQYINDCPTLDDKINTLKTLDLKIRRFIENHGLYAKVRYMVIIDKLLKIQESHVLDIYLNGIFTESLKDIDQILIAIDVRRGKINDEQANAKLEIIANDYEKRIDEVNTALVQIKNAYDTGPYKSTFIQEVAEGTKRVVCKSISAVARWLDSFF